MALGSFRSPNKVDSKKSVARPRNVLFSATHISSTVGYALCQLFM